MTSIYFPGDGPILEMLLLLSVGLFLLWLVLFSTALIFSFFKKRKFEEKKVLAFIGIIPICLGFLAISVIGMRNFGEWRELKKELKIQSHRVEQSVPEKGRMLTLEEFKTIKSELFKEPVIFKSKSLKHPIEIRMMQTIPPYVGVDFGEGKNAVFDLRTMIVTYSD